MPSHDTLTLRGKVTDIFSHRFVILTAKGKVLADLTPNGAERIRLREGEEIEITGEGKPSEVKVNRVLRADGSVTVIEQKPTMPKPERHPPQHHHHKPDPERVLRSALAEGFAPISRPRRRPKHFEILARNEQGEPCELHVEFDGRIRKVHRVGSDDPKWEDDIRHLPPG